MWLVWKGFQEWLEFDHSESLCKLSDSTHTLCDIHENASHESLNAALTNDSCIEIMDLFVAYQDVLRQNSGQLVQFWMIYSDMVEVLLGLLRADREGDWTLHLACIRSYSMVLCFRQSEL